MPKFHIARDERKLGGPKCSRSIEAPTREEAQRIFDESWVMLCASRGHGATEEPEDEGGDEPERISGHYLPVITADDLRREYMSPAALAVKQVTQGIMR